MASPVKRTRDLAKVDYDQAIAKLETTVEKKKTSRIPTAIQQVEEAWEKLKTSQDEYVLELNDAGNSDEAKRINKEFADLESDKEDIIELGEKISAKETEPDTGEEVKEEDKNKGAYRTVKAFGSAIVSKGKNVLENVQNTVSSVLGGIQVSKKQFEEFQTALKDQLVSSWDETVETKVFHGIEIDSYPEFLDLFQSTTGIDDKVKDMLKTMKFTERLDDKVKTFTCQGTDTSGKYGMYMALKRPQVS